MLRDLCVFSLTGSLLRWTRNASQSGLGYRCQAGRSPSRAKRAYVRWPRRRLSGLGEAGKRGCKEKTNPKANTKRLPLKAAVVREKVERKEEGARCEVADASVYHHDGGGRAALDCFLDLHHRQPKAGEQSKPRQRNYRPKSPGCILATTLKKAQSPIALRADSEAEQARHALSGVALAVS
ncbi:hypothetical protein BC567DRAFT_252232 [Phyllosticta citribraziliensis]